MNNETIKEQEKVEEMQKKGHGNNELPYDAEIADIPEGVYKVMENPPEDWKLKQVKRILEEALREIERLLKI